MRVASASVTDSSSRSRASAALSFCRKSDSRRLISVDLASSSPPLQRYSAGFQRFPLCRQRPLARRPRRVVLDALLAQYPFRLAQLLGPCAELTAQQLELTLACRRRLRTQRERRRLGARPFERGLQLCRRGRQPGLLVGE